MKLCHQPLDSRAYDLGRPRRPSLWVRMGPSQPCRYGFRSPDRHERVAERVHPSRWSREWNHMSHGRQEASGFLREITLRHREAGRMMKRRVPLTVRDSSEVRPLLPQLSAPIRDLNTGIHSRGPGGGANGPRSVGGYRRGFPKTVDLTLPAALGFSHGAKRIRLSSVNMRRGLRQRILDRDIGVWKSDAFEVRSNVNLNSNGKRGERLDRYDDSVLPRRSSINFSRYAFLKANRGCRSVDTLRDGQTKTSVVKRSHTLKILPFTSIMSNKKFHPGKKCRDRHISLWVMSGSGNINAIEHHYQPPNPIYPKIRWSNPAMGNLGHANACGGDSNKFHPIVKADIRTKIRQKALSAGELVRLRTHTIYSERLSESTEMGEWRRISSVNDGVPFRNFILQSRCES